MSERVHSQSMLADISPNAEDSLTPRSTYEVFSQSQSVHFHDLRRANPAGIELSGMNGHDYVIETQSLRYPGATKKTTYSLSRSADGNIYALKRELSYARPILNNGKPHPLDTLRRITYGYDEENYLTQEVDMEFGKYGHRYLFSYKTLPDGKRVLHLVTGQLLSRQGFLEPGLPIGEKVTMDFSEFHFPNAQDVNAQ